MFEEMCEPALPRLDFVPRSGGLFKDFTIHDLDTARWITGDSVVEVFAMGSCLVDPEIGKLGDIDTAKLEQVLHDRPGEHIAATARDRGWRRLGVYGLDYVMTVRDYRPLEGFEILPFDVEFDLARAQERAKRGTAGRMWRTAHQHTLAGPTRLTARVCRQDVRWTGWCRLPESAPARSCFRRSSSFR